MVKRLHFASNLVPLILSGKKTLTWRLWDDKKLSKGDIVDFIESGIEKHFVRVKLTKVKIKKMGELDEGDKAGHEKFKSDKEMYKTYSTYYGRKVTSDTKVKVVWFEKIS